MKAAVGDRFVISCAPRDVRVVRVMRREVFVEWPWGTPDPTSRHGWDGDVSVPIDPTHPDWAQTPWRLEPRTGLTAGDRVQLSIPPTEVVVQEVLTFDEPRDIGRINRPTGALRFDVGFFLWIDHDEPIEFSPPWNT
jgi:hypothetical protein